MREFLDYCLRRYLRASGWNEENQYSNLCVVPRELLDFTIPYGLSFRIAKSPTSLLKSAFSIHALPVLNGSIGYLFTSLPLNLETGAPHLRETDRFRIFAPPSKQNNLEEIQRTDNDYLIYGRMFLPTGTLETLYTRRISPQSRYFITAISNPRPKEPSYLTTQLQYDNGKYCSELFFSTDAYLFGLRGLYNFGKGNTPRPHLGDDASKTHEAMQVNTESESSHESENRGGGQWSAGGELYFAAKDKSGGLSLGVRYCTRPLQTNSPPITATFTLNPIVGYLSTTYSAEVSDRLALCSRFDFNVYSYESDLVMGMEWRSADPRFSKVEELAGGWAADSIEAFEGERDEKATPSLMEMEPTSEVQVVETPVPPEDKRDARLESLLKARIGVNKGLALIWEGRWNRRLLFGLGLVADLSDRSSPIRSVGLEIQYFS
ncbi:uncharacterized protein VTP21DRAFT_11250 [Calcarisporiella thermophila]|uniref:uncharacterized protein n=1 Tax=Calcarisporiella thermophila TaxID=911321 RepID=UPI0037447173